MSSLSDRTSNFQRSGRAFHRDAFVPFLLWCLQDECANFIRLIEPWNRTQLYVCGTGAYNPVCTFVNRGRKPQVCVTTLVLTSCSPHSPSVAHQLIRQLPSWLALHWLDATACSSLTMMLVTVPPLSLSPKTSWLFCSHPQLPFSTSVFFERHSKGFGRSDIDILSLVLHSTRVIGICYCDSFASL